MEDSTEEIIKDKKKTLNKKKEKNGKKVNKDNKRKNSQELSSVKEIPQNGEHFSKKTKTGNSTSNLLKPKQLHKEKKKAIAEFEELQNVLGIANAKDEKEKELEALVLGFDADDIEYESSDLSAEEEREEEDEEEEKKIHEKDKKKSAWEDEDDENILVEEKAESLKKCHRSISARGNEKLSDLVQEQFKKIVGEPKWAEIGRKESSDDDSDDELLMKTGNYIEPSTSLVKGEIRIQKCPNLVDESFKKAAIKSVEFHPTSRVALVAGTNGTANLFQIDGKINAKIQTVNFQNFPIHSAHFTLDGQEFLVGSDRHAHFYSFNMLSGKVVRVPWNKGMEQKNIRRFHISPDGKYIVIHGRYGYIHLVTTKSKEWIGSLKMNGEVISIAFNKDGSLMFSHGDTGEIYVWDMNSRKCLHKFVDEGSVIGTALAVSPNDQFLATGSDSGIVNIYDSKSLLESNTPHPVKVLKNLTTEVTNMKFNCTSELLAMSSAQKQNAVKLVHFPSMSVFHNFPAADSQSKLSFINCLDISVNSGYLSLGNNLSTVHIFRLKHYHNY